MQDTEEPFRSLAYLYLHSFRTAKYLLSQPASRSAFCFVWRCMIVQRPLQNNIFGTKDL
jgi:hypothetical protein